jgi:hypothetical protein
MATIVNERDLILQGSSVRIISSGLAPNIVVPGLRSLILTGPTNVIKIDSGGNPTPTEVLLTATLKSLTGNVNWAILSGNATLTGTGNSRTLSYGNMHSDYVTVQASLTVDGVTYTSEFSVTKVRDGASASSGPRSMLYLYGTAETWSNTVADQVILNATGSFTKVLGDHVTLRNVAQTWSETRYWSGFEWVSPGQIINGNMLITGTLSATKIYGGMLGGVTIGIGTGHSRGGFGFEVDSVGVIEADNLFSEGFIYISNFYYPNINAIKGVLEHNSTQHTFGVIGQVSAGYNSSFNHGVRGWNVPYGTSGVVGTAAGYDFYADGGGINYGPFTGAHDALVDRGHAYRINVGDIVVDAEKVASRNISNTLFRVVPSEFANQPAALGVVACECKEIEGLIPSALVAGHREILTKQANGSYRPTYEKTAVPEFAQIQKDYVKIAVNALGEGQINVCNEGGDIAAGDLIVCSSRRGKGMKQADGIVRNYTVAKARESCTFANPGEVKMIACIYLCG